MLSPNDKNLLEMVSMKLKSLLPSALLIIAIAGCTPLVTTFDNQTVKSEGELRDGEIYIMMNYKGKAYEFPENQLKEGDVICSIPGCESKIRLKQITRTPVWTVLPMTYATDFVTSFYEFEEVPSTTPVTTFKKRGSPPPGQLSGPGATNTGPNAGNTPPVQYAP